MALVKTKDIFMCYPAKLAAIAPEFLEVPGATESGAPRRYVFLRGFSMLKVERCGRGFQFNEVRQVDEGGSASIDLLERLASELDEDCSIAGLRLDRTIAALVRVPRDDPRDAQSKPALLRLRSALRNDPVDADWFGDRPVHRTLESLTERYDLAAEWRVRGTECNPAILERRLAARAQAIWLTLTLELLPEAENRRALADYDAWRTAHSIV